MEILHSPAPVLYLCAAALTVWGGVSRRELGRILSFLGGLCWAAGTVYALVEGAALSQVLTVTLGLLLLSALFPGRAEQ